jgi:hypothetical protein
MLLSYFLLPAAASSLFTKNRIPQFVRQPVDGHHSNFTSSTTTRQVPSQNDRKFHMLKSLEILTYHQSFLSLCLSLPLLDVQSISTWDETICMVRFQKIWVNPLSSFECKSIIIAEARRSSSQEVPVYLTVTSFHIYIIITFCRRLHLDHNQFNGTIPSSYMSIGNGRLESLSLNHNQLTGWVPDDFTIWNKMSTHTFQHFCSFCFYYCYFRSSLPILLY